MSFRKQLDRWLDVRPHEWRPLILAFLGAFLIIAYMILARSLREALYLTTFDVKTLPYITLGVAFLGLPTVGNFSRLLSRYPTDKVLRGILILTMLGLGILSPFIDRSSIAVVAFYLWTAMATIVLTSGFWIMVSEHFPLRGAKRLFGLISAGGTAGAMVAGTSLGRLTKVFGVAELIPLLVGLLGIFLITHYFYPEPLRGEGVTEDEPRAQTSIREAMSIIIENKHLRYIALIVGTATLASTLVDYQFKEWVRGTISNKASLAGYFGAFYGWTGAVSLFVQLLLTSRIMSRYGIGWALAMLPLFLLLGSLVLLVVPGLILVTLVRGSDNSLRKSLHRSALEVLYVPVPSLLRRKTKAFIDSMVDTGAEGLGAGLIFLWVTLNNFSSRYLSVAVVGLAGFFLYQARRMNREYYATLVRRLEEGNDKIKSQFEQHERLAGRDLLSVSFTSLDLQKSLKERGIVFEKPGEVSGFVSEAGESQDPIDLLGSSDSLKISKALNEIREWRTQHVPHLIRLLPRQAFYPSVTEILAGMGEMARPQLTEILADEATDFIIRRRIPRVLSKIEDPRAGDALLLGLRANRFEVRYRSAIALVRRRKQGFPLGQGDWQMKVWDAIRFEVNRDKAIWEIQRILDEVEEPDADDFVKKQVDLRGELSLEHTFRMLTLVLPPVPVKTAFQGILFNDEKLKSFALEYLELVLPQDIRQRLWAFIGDISEYQKEKSIRPLNEVVEDLVNTGITLFGDKESKRKLKEALGKLGE